MKQGYALITELASRLGVEFTHAAMSGKDCPKRFGNFANARKRLDVGNLDDVLSIQLSVVPDQLKAFGADPKTDFDVSIALDNELGLFVLSVCERLARNLDGLLQEFAPFSSVFETQYGYAFEAARIEGPMYFALGMDFGEPSVPTDEDEHENHVILHWSALALDQPDRPERWHALRSIYPLQLITEHHLALRVGRAKLGNWIKQDPQRGTLSPFQPGLWSWAVPEASIEAVRQTLYEADLLWAWWPFGADEPDEDRSLGARS